MKTEYTEKFNYKGAEYLWNSICAYELVKAGYKAPITEMIDSLDMSREEDLSGGGIIEWLGSIRAEILAYKLECPEMFE